MSFVSRMFLISITFGGPTLSAQLVEKVTPAPATRRATATSPTPVKKPAVTKGLDAYGISKRTLASWKRSGAREDLGFKVVTLQRKSTSDQGFPTFEMFGRDAFATTANPSLVGQVRLSPTGPEMSVDSGRSWSQGEKSKDSWLFAFDNQMVTLDPMDESFSPSDFKAFGFERGVVVKDRHGLENQFGSPLFHSAVMAFAYGRNEVQGIIKFPGTTFVVPFQGIRSNGKWIARTIGATPFVGDLTKRRTDGNHLSHGLKNQLSPEIVQIELNDQRLLLGVGSYLNYAILGEPSERLNQAIEFDCSKAKDLPELSQSFHANYNRSIWTKSDEEPSFSREAEKAFVQAGLRAWFWEPYVYIGNGYGSGAYEKEGHGLIDPMLQRVQAIGGTCGLLDDNDVPITGQRPGLPSASVQLPPSSATAKLPKLTVDASSAGGHLVSVHFPSELRLWSDGLKVPNKRIPSAPGEFLTSAAMAPDGRVFATSSSAGVRLWNAESGQPVGMLPMDNCKGYYCTAYAADGSMIAGGGSDGRTRLWESGSGKLIATIKGAAGFSISLGSKPSQGKKDFIASLAFSNDGKRIAEGVANGELRIWDLSDPTQPRKLKSIDLDDFGKVWKVHFLKGGQELLAVNQAGSYKVFDTATWKLTRKNDSVMPKATSIQYSAADDYFVTSYENGRVTRTNLSSGMIEGDLTITGIACGALIQREGKFFLLGDEDWKVVQF